MTLKCRYITKSIINKVRFDQSMGIMELGSGPLLERIAPLVKKITAIDISKSMNIQLREKKPL